MSDIPEDVQAELDDPLYTNRLHYCRSTYALGCRGPLCRKAERDRFRIKYRKKVLSEGKRHFPCPRTLPEEDELLNKIIAWHRYEMEGRRLQRQAERRLAKKAS